MTTGHPAHQDPVVRFTNVVVGILDVETGQDAIALALHLTARSRELTCCAVESQVAWIERGRRGAALHDFAARRKADLQNLALATTDMR
jgi:hypothetical protein